jgi:hypothetical protein
VKRFWFEFFPSQTLGDHNHATFVGMKAEVFVEVRDAQIGCADYQQEEQ